MATVSSVALTQPSSDPNINESDTFVMGGQITKATHGGIDADMHWQWDQGLGDSPANFVDIPTSGADLTTADTNPLAGVGDEAEHTITVTGVNAGSYFVRVETIDNNDSGASDVSASQAVTVNAAAADDTEWASTQGNNNQGPVILPDEVLSYRQKLIFPVLLFPIFPKFRRF